MTHIMLREGRLVPHLWAELHRILIFLWKTRVLTGMPRALGASKNPLMCSILHSTGIKYEK